MTDNKTFNPKERFSTLGRTTLKKLNKMRIYVEGLSRIGPDVVTNLVLLNPELIAIYDRQVIQPLDCYHTFHYPRDQANKNFRKDCLLDICKRINKKATVKKLEEELAPEQASRYDLLIFCDVYDVERILRINTHLRQNKLNETGIIYACQLGFYGFVFTDFGETFKLMNTGKHLPVLLIDNITNEEEGRVTVNPQFKHGFKHGDFVRIDNVEGMKQVNGDARPVKIIDDYTFVIENTKHYGKYQGGGICQKVKMTERLSFTSLKDQILAPEFSEEQKKKGYDVLMLATSAILSFYENNNKLPELFNEMNENQVFQNAESINNKPLGSNENYLRTIFRSCEYGFYPLIHLLAAVVSMECVKKTGKYNPLPTPYFVNWYDKINFQVKKKVEGQFLNIIETETLEKLMKMQLGIIDDGAQSLELLSLLFSVQVAQNRKLVLFGLQTLEEKQAGDPLVIKAHVKFDISGELFKARKMESLPCTLSFANDIMLTEAWRRIKLLINASQQINEYIYDNVVLGEIDLIDCQFSDLKALLRTCMPNRSRLREQININIDPSNLPNEFKYAVEWAVDLFNLLFIDLFEDVRCFGVCGPGYVERIGMPANRKVVFYLLLTCIESGGYISPENIVKISKSVFNTYFVKEVKSVLEAHPQNFWTGYHKKPVVQQLDLKDPLVDEFLTSCYHLLNWFFTHEKLQGKKVINTFNQYLYKEEDDFTDREREQIAFTKVELMSKFKIPYNSLIELYKNQFAVQFIWNASRLRARAFAVEEEISSKKFFKFYYRKTKPCPFVHQIVTAHVPVAIIQLANNRPKNLEVDILDNLIKESDPLPALPIEKPKDAILFPQNANEWSLIVIEGPKKMEDLLERFKLDGLTVEKVRWDKRIIYPFKGKEYLSKTVQEMCGEKRRDYELLIEAVTSKDSTKVQLCRIKYTLP